MIYGYKQKRKLLELKKKDTKHKFEHPEEMTKHIEHQVEKFEKKKPNSDTHQH